jgi:methenyltetrahydrofolate cyclohydrolase
MSALAEQPLREVLEEVAARTPAPGGGSSSAWACALGAGLVEMSARFGSQDGDRAAGRDGLRALGDRAAELRGQLLELAERDLDSYRPVLEARRLPHGDPERARRLEAALTEASEVPLEVARIAAEVAGLGAEVAAAGQADLRGDAIVSVLLAEAAARSAASLVERNLVRRPADARLGEARAAGELAARAKQEVLA